MTTMPNFKSLQLCCAMLLCATPLAAQSLTPAAARDSSAGVRYRFDSVPFGASVFYRMKLLGTTPLLFDSPLKLDSAVVFTLGRFNDESLWPADAKETAKNFFVLTAKLRPLSDAMLLENPPVSETDYTKRGFFTNLTEKRSNNFYKYVASATAVVAGVSAAYFKLQADSRYTTYAQTFDRQYLDQSRQLDVWSGISLALSQLALGFLTYLFLSE